MIAELAKIDNPIVNPAGTVPNGPPSLILPEFIAPAPSGLTTPGASGPVDLRTDISALALEVAAIPNPEPATLVLFGSAALALASRRFRRGASKN